MAKIKAVILRNEQPEDHLLWQSACNDFSYALEYRIVDLTKNAWLEEIQSEKFDILLARPCGLTSHFKQLYDERIYILSNILKYYVFPSLDEILVYENKRLLSFWLKANKIPHPETNIFYGRAEAAEFVKGHSYPIVGKVNIGGAGSGVLVLYNVSEALMYIKDTFTGKGAPRRAGPNLAKGGLFKRGFHYVMNPSDIRGKLDIYKTVKTHPQKEFVIFQEYIPHQFEWRAVRIGDSFFAHKKLKIGDKASGSLLKEYGKPPVDIFDFVKDITDKHKFYSQALDIFESERGYLINEMQCFFGQSDPYQMIIDNKPGRYVFFNGEWKFEEGSFNSNQSYNLRLEWIILTLNHLK